MSKIRHEGGSLFYEDKQVAIVSGEKLEIDQDSKHLSGPLTMYARRENLIPPVESSSGSKSIPGGGASSKPIPKGSVNAESNAVVNALDKVAEKIGEQLEQGKVALLDRDEQRIEEGKVIYKKSKNPLIRWAMREYENPVALRSHGVGGRKVAIINVRNFDTRNGPIEFVDDNNFFGQGKDAVITVPNPSMINRGTNEDEEGVDMGVMANGVMDWVVKWLGKDEAKKIYEGRAIPGINPSNGDPFVRGYKYQEPEEELIEEQFVTPKIKFD